jgi:hypothetical protein
VRHTDTLDGIKEEGFILTDFYKQEAGYAT